MTRPTTKHHIDGLLVLLLFGVFAFCILSVLLTGAQVNQRLAQRDDEAYDFRTAGQYLATKVRQSAGAHAVSVVPFGGTQALVLSEEIEGSLYLTRIYCYDGYIRELFSSAEDGMAPEDGEIILPAQALTFSLEGGLLSARLTDGNGTPLALNLALRGGEEGAA